jgi:hypothetical protein
MALAHPTAFCGLGRSASPETTGDVEVGYEFGWPTNVDNSVLDGRCGQAQRAIADGTALTKSQKNLRAEGHIVHVD